MTKTHTIIKLETTNGIKGKSWYGHHYDERVSFGILVDTARPALLCSINGVYSMPRGPRVICRARSIRDRACVAGVPPDNPLSSWTLPHDAV